MYLDCLNLLETVFGLLHSLKNVFRISQLVCKCILNVKFRF